MKHASIIVCHYSLVDDFGELRATGSLMTRSEMLKRCILSLKENTDYPAEIIVMDNGGNPDDTDWLVGQVREGVIDTLVRYKNNMNFAFAWNQGFRLATGDYVCFTCNDIEFKPKWLSSCVSLLEKYPERKLIASPYISPEKNRPNWNKEVLPDGARINSLAGSACFITTPEVFKDIGEMPHHRVGGSIWHRRMCRMGYQVIIPPVDLVEHLGFRGGTNYYRQLNIERTLLNGEKVQFNYKYEGNKNYYEGGIQKPAEVKL